MKKAKIISVIDNEISEANLEDFTLFEEKMTKIRCIREIKENLDKTFLTSSIDELGLKGKKISASKLKKVFKKVLTKMMEELEL